MPFLVWNYMNRDMDAIGSVRDVWFFVLVVCVIFIIFVTVYKVYNLVSNSKKRKIKLLQKNGFVKERDSNIFIKRYIWRTKDYSGEISDEYVDKFDYSQLKTLIKLTIHDS